MAGIVGKKVGMMRVFSPEGTSIGCTWIQAGPCTVTQVKLLEKDGYEAVQLGYDNAKPKNTTQPLAGHFKKANTDPKKKLVELPRFRKVGGDEDLKLGDTIRVGDIFSVEDRVSVAGISKGKGFQGVVRRHGFAGVGQSTHGQHNRQRAPGSIGASSTPSRVFKGMRMAGRMGGGRAKVVNLRVMRILDEENMLLVSGSVPGAKNGYLIISK